MKTKIISIIMLLFFFGCTKVIENDPVSGCMDESAINFDESAEVEGDCGYVEKIYVTAQGFDQLNILESIDGVIQEEQNIISVNFIENMMDTPHFVEIDNQNNFWFVTLINSGKVLMFDLIDNIMIDSIMVGDSPALMTHDPVQKILYVSRMMPMNGMMGMPEAESNNIQVLDYSSDNLVNVMNFELPASAPHGLDLSDDGQFLFVASNTTDWVYKIETSSGNILNEIYIPDPENPFGPEEINYFKPIQLKYFNNNIFISCSAGKFYNGQTEVDIPGKIIVLDSSTFEIVDMYEFDWHSSPWHIAIDELSNEIFVAFAGDMGNMGSAGIAKLSIENNLLIHNWTKVGTEFSTCHGIAMSTNSNQVYLSGRGNGVLHSIDRNDGSIIQSITINSILDGMMGAMLGGIAVN